LKVPSAIPLFCHNNAYDLPFTIVYARPGGQADLYLMSQK
jgi:hypothetical protein